jgi:DNA primase catalytic core
MIVEVSSSASFGKLADYLEYGRGANRVEDPSERVAWTKERNLLGQSGQALALEMRDVAALNDRVEKPVYHMVLSWKSSRGGGPPDRPAKEEMLAAAEKVLERIGLADHQAWIVAHKDTEAPHLHVMVNTVHPRTLNVWDRWRDVPRIRAVLNDIEREQGWSRPPQAEELARRGWTSRQRQPFWEQDHTGGPPSFRASAGLAMEEHLARAESWAETRAGLQAWGLRLEPRRSGLVIAGRDASGTERYAKLSSLGEGLSKGSLETRFGQTYEAHVREQALEGRGVEPAVYPKMRQAVGEAAAEAETFAQLVQRLEAHGAKVRWERTPGAQSTGRRAAQAQAAESQGAGVPVATGGSLWIEMDHVETEARRLGAAFGREALEQEHGVGAWPDSRSEVEPETVEKAIAEGSHEQRMEEERVLDFATRFYRDALEGLGSEERPKTYLQAERGFTGQTLRAFQVGYAPDAWSALSEAALQAGFSEEALMRAGLAVERGDAGEARARGQRGVFDRFRGRIMFPFLDEDGQTIGFGARRVWADAERVTPPLRGRPKYINSPASAHFDKQSALFGLNQAQEAMQRSRRAYLVEGYTDVLRLRQEGIENAVALSGVVMSPWQARHLAERAGDVVVLLDGGEREGAARAALQLVRAGAEGTVVSLPAGQDPDELAREIGGEGLRRYGEEHGRTFAEAVLVSAREEGGSYRRAEGGYASAQKRTQAMHRYFHATAQGPEEKQTARLQELADATAPAGLNAEVRAAHTEHLEEAFASYVEQHRYAKQERQRSSGVGRAEQGRSQGAPLAGGIHGGYLGEKVEAVRQATSIARVASEYTELTPSGGELVGLSPFKEEQNPSFRVNDQKGVFYDFSTGRGGDVFELVGQLEGVDFTESVRLLAERAGIDLEQRSQDRSQERTALNEAPPDGTTPGTVTADMPGAEMPTADRAEADQTVDDRVVEGWRRVADSARVPSGKEIRFDLRSSETWARAAPETASREAAPNALNRDSLEPGLHATPEAEHREATLREAETLYRQVRSQRLEAEARFDRLVGKVYQRPEKARAARRENSLRFGAAAGVDAVAFPARYEESAYVAPGPQHSRRSVDHYRRQLKKSGLRLAAAQQQEVLAVEILRRTQGRAQVASRQPPHLADPLGQWEDAAIRAGARAAARAGRRGAGPREQFEAGREELSVRIARGLAEGYVASTAARSAASEAERFGAAEQTSKVEQLQRAREEMSRYPAPEHLAEWAGRVYVAASPAAQRRIDREILSGRSLSDPSGASVGRDESMGLGASKGQGASAGRASRQGRGVAAGATRSGSAALGKAAGMGAEPFIRSGGKAVAAGIGGGAAGLALQSFRQTVKTTVQELGSFGQEL